MYLTCKNACGFCLFVCLSFHNVKCVEPPPTIFVWNRTLLGLETDRRGREDGGNRSSSETVFFAVSAPSNNKSTDLRTWIAEQRLIGPCTRNRRAGNPSRFVVFCSSPRRRARTTKVTCTPTGARGVGRGIKRERKHTQTHTQWLFFLFRNFHALVLL